MDLHMLCLLCSVMFSMLFLCFYGALFVVVDEFCMLFSCRLVFSMLSMLFYAFVVLYLHIIVFVCFSFFLIELARARPEAHIRFVSRA